MMPTIAQMFIDRGIEQGIELGLTQGEAKGKVELILLILTKHFKTVPQLVQDRLLALTDLQELNQLADFALDCNSMAEFKNALRK